MISWTVRGVIPYFERRDAGCRNGRVGCLAYHGFRRNRQRGQRECGGHHGRGRLETILAEKRYIPV